MTSETFKSLGNKVTEFEKFETFSAPIYSSWITMESDEVTALCPVTSAPDWYIVKISYRSRLKCLESKTLKLYLQSFRNKGLFCEKFASTICGDLRQALDPEALVVTVIQKPRGGVSINATAEYRRLHEDSRFDTKRGDGQHHLAV
jgi:7-cyano-7-deazaguanine reductase